MEEKTRAATKTENELVDISFSMAQVMLERQGLSYEEREEWMKWMQRQYENLGFYGTPMGMCWYRLKSVKEK